jgi:hypothetical protein
MEKRKPFFYTFWDGVEALVLRTSRLYVQELRTAVDPGSFGEKKTSGAAALYRYLFIPK